MKKNSVRLICTSVASGDTKNYAVVPVKVGKKKIDYTEEELKILAESILNPKAKATAPDIDAVDTADVIDSYEPEEIKDTAAEAEEPAVEETEKAPAAEDDAVADEPVYEAVEAEEPAVEETEEAPAVEDDAVADEPVYVAAEAEEPAVEETEEAPVASEEIVAQSAVPQVAPAYQPVAEEPVHRKQRRGLSLTTKKALSGWLFVLPFVIGILFIYAPIIFDSIRYTFVASDSIYTGTFQWVGFENYVYIFTTDEWFSLTIVDGLMDLILQIPAIVIFSLFMAIILNQKMTGRTVFRAIFFLPVILCTGIIDSIDANSAFMDQIEGSQGGIDDNTGAAAGGIVSALDIEALLSNIKLGSELVDIVTTLINNIFDIVSRSGVQMLIFLSGLQSISPSIYESCQVEGASAWETFWKITLPMISPMIFVNAIYTVIDLFTAADNRVMSYIFGTQVYGKSLYAEAGAMAWVYIGIVLIFIVVVALLMKAVVFYQKRD